MENLRRILRVLFLQRDSDKVIASAYGAAPQRMDTMVDAEWVAHAFRELDGGYNLDQINSIVGMMTSMWMRPDSTVVRMKFCDDASVFNTLLHFNLAVLTCQRDEPVCKFDSLLRWNDITSLLGEDIFTTSAMASMDVVSLYRRNKFSWTTVIRHDNSTLNALFSRRMADLHSHMKGSSLNFELNWLSLMNQLGGRSDSFKLLRMAQEPVRLIVNEDRTVSSLYLSATKAGAIRFMLLMEVLGTDVPDGLKNLFNSILKSQSYAEVLQYINHLDRLLLTERRMFAKRYRKDFAKDIVVDYAIQSWMVNELEENHLFLTLLVGERYIMYSMFCKIFQNSLINPALSTLFYAYLLIKARIRHEIVQLNDFVGFENFNIYEGRKEIFIDKRAPYEAMLSQLAINAFFENKAPGSCFETRIVPKDSNTGIARQMSKLRRETEDGHFCNKQLSDKSNCHYLFHFIKESDKTPDSMLRSCPRHYKLREKVKKQALAIYNWRNSYHEYVDRVVGIDAANSECKCRPEVFAQAYRFLRDCPILSGKPEHEVPQLHFTYHVGEDFFDIIDGLRAVDEVLKYLNFRNGDRFGHGLVLGTDVRSYYRKRDNVVVMSKQSILDNVAWVLCRFSGLKEVLCLNQELLNIYEYYIRDIYGLDSSLPTVSDYYQSWLLRGDSPEAYASDSVKSNIKGKWYYYSLNNHPDCVKARMNSQARLLYQRYHYDETVKRRGREGAQIKLSPQMVSMIEVVQEMMLNEIEKMKICIESNPTSNRKIGEIDTYDMHPLIRFYNLSLNTEYPKHGISVSINTDDRGVFATSIEREFSVVAVAMEKKYCKNNSSISPREIYDWLDKIREMAFEQI